MDSHLSHFSGLSAVLEAMPDAFVITDDKARIVLINKQTETLFGYERTELLGEYIEQLMPERFRQHHQQQRNNYIESPHIRPLGAGFNLWGLHKNGKEFPVEISLSPLKTDDGVLTLAVIRGVTSFKQAVVENKPSKIISKSVLIIDDEPYLLKSIQRLLANFHQVTSALGGPEGLERLRKDSGKFDAIVCDLTMPDMDGADIYYFLQQRFPSLEKRMIFITGGAYLPKLEEFIIKEKITCLEKPFNAADLLNAIEMVSKLKDG